MTSALTAPVSPDTSPATVAGPPRPIPGSREPGAQVRFASPRADAHELFDRAEALDAATVADRQREGGGGPSQRPGGAESDGGTGPWARLRRLL